MGRKDMWIVGICILCFIVGVVGLSGVDIYGYIAGLFRKIDGAAQGFQNVFAGVKGVWDSVKDWFSGLFK